MKICSSCNIGKPHSDFYKHSRYSDGYQGTCKSCQAERRHDLEHSEIRQTSYKKYRVSLKGKKSRIECSRRYKHKHPEKVKTHSIAQRARDKGILIPEPCEVCGVLKVDGHHDDYSKPLEVRWLCRIHHNLFHRST